MKKRGIGHIEVILAFILFMGAVSFALYYFSPIKQNISFSQAGDIANTIINNASVNVISYSIIINGSVTPAIGSKFKISLSDVPSNMNALVEGNNTRTVEIVRTVTNNFCLKGSPAWGHGDDDFIYLRFNEEFAPSTTSCTEDADNDYAKVSSRDVENIPSEKRMLSLNSSYYLDYGKLKNNLGIREGSDFGFTFNFANGEKIESQKNIPAGVEIFSETRKMEVLRKNGKIEYGEMIVRTW